MKLFADSGAYSAWTNKTSIDINEYIEFIWQNKDYLETYACLDDITDPDKTWENQEIMEKAGLSPLPVYHVDEPDKYLDRAMSYDYFAVGGMALKGAVSRRNRFNYVFSRVCTKENDYFPTKKVHGFGLASPDLLVDYPWYCMTEENHTVLTKNGKWSDLSSLSVGDEILSFDNGKTVWLPIEEIPVFNVDNIEINHTWNQNFEAYTTNNHRWVVTNKRAPKKRKEYVWRTTNTLTYEDAIPRVGKYYDFLTEPIYSDEQIALLAWAWTDGSIGNIGTNVRIHQSEIADPEKCNIIKNLLIKSKENYCVNYVCNGMLDFEMYGDISKWITKIAPNKKLPADLPFQLTKHQAEMFIENSVLADGCVGRLKRAKSFAISVKRPIKKQNLEVLRVICLLLGIPTSISGSSRNHKTLQSSSVTYVYVDSLYEEKTKYSGKLWCVRVKSGAFYTKCNNKIYVTGNSVDTTSWVMYGRFGIILIPRMINGSVRYDKPPYVITISSRSKSVGKLSHYNQFGEDFEQPYYRDYCTKRGFPIGLTELKYVPPGYVLQENEKWTDRKKKDRVEVVIEKGLCCDGEMRDRLNLQYFLDLEKYQKKWPWAWKHQDEPLFTDEN